MATEIRRLAAGDYDTALDFINLVFSMAHGPHDFAAMLPLLYQPTDERMACNWVVLEDGKLRALVGVFPLAWHIGGATLRVAGVGGVATHPAARGQGHMQTLMQRAVATMRAEGYDLSWLGGQRQRYQHYGYEVAGTMYNATLGKANLKRAAATQPPLTFTPLAPTDNAGWAAAQAWHAAGGPHTVWVPTAFIQRGRSWRHAPWLARTPAGTAVGYLVANHDGTFVAEVGAADDATAYALLTHWAATRERVNIELSPLEPGLLSRVAAVAESLTVRSSSNWQVFAWPTVLQALLQARVALAPTLPGRVVLEITGAACLAMEVDGTTARVAPTTAAPDLSVGPLEALRVLGGPLRPSQVLALPARALVLDTWCPLPLAWRTQDGV